MTSRPSLASQLAEIHNDWASVLSRLIGLEITILERQGLLYGCDCTRKAIAAAGSETFEHSELRYTKRCRDRGLPLDDAHSAVDCRLVQPRPHVRVLTGFSALCSAAPVLRRGKMLYCPVESLSPEG